MAEKKWNRPLNCDQCKHCKKECTVHWTQIINGQVYKLDMCDECPAASQLKEPVEFSLLEELLGGTLKAIENAGIPHPSAAAASLPVSSKNLKCPKCGYTEVEFQKTGRLGCPDCYQLFLAPKMDLLSKMHKGVTHKGKEPKPKKSADIDVPAPSVEDLKQKLGAAIKVENYEEAARLRDEINALEKGPKKQTRSKAEKPSNAKKKSK